MSQEGHQDGVKALKPRLADTFSVHDRGHDQHGAEEQHDGRERAQDQGPVHGRLICTQVTGRQACGQTAMMEPGSNATGQYLRGTGGKILEAH